MVSCRPRRAVALSSRGTRMRSHIKSLGVMETRRRRLSRSLKSLRIAADAVVRHVIRHPPEERFPGRVDRGLMGSERPGQPDPADDAAGARYLCPAEAGVLRCGVHVDACRPVGWQSRAVCRCGRRRRTARLTARRFSAAPTAWDEGDPWGGTGSSEAAIVKERMGGSIACSQTWAARKP